MSVWLAVEVWAARRPPATVIPEGGDDIEMRGARTTFVQVKSRREHLGDYPVGKTAKHIKGLWVRSGGASPQPSGFELIVERGVAGLTPAGDGVPNITANPRVPGLTPRAILEKFSTLQMADVHLPTIDGRRLILPRHTQPNADH
ncbi:MAG: hypothetical protein OXG56_10780, partial [Gammaproteobacteria bacterium]|nr:hypothetical protein [Gammaproteobacteria bacterium]